MQRISKRAENVAWLEQHTLNDLGCGTTGTVALESCISISSLPQQIAQLLAGLQLVLLFTSRPTRFRAEQYVGASGASNAQQL